MRRFYTVGYFLLDETIPPYFVETEDSDLTLWGTFNSCEGGDWKIVCNSLRQPNLLTPWFVAFKFKVLECIIFFYLNPTRIGVRKTRIEDIQARW